MEVPPPSIVMPPIIRQQESPMEEVLLSLILCCDKIIESVKGAKFFKFECYEVDKQVQRLRQMLRSAIRLAISTSPGSRFYDPPLRYISAVISKNLEKSRILVKKCRRRNIFLRVVSRVSAADFQRLFNLLDSAVADMKWVLSIFDAAGGLVLALPPVAGNDPIVSWVWSSIAVLHVGILQYKIDSANELASLAKVSDRNKQIIITQGGVLPLLKLLKDSSSLEAQLAAAAALYNLANDAERVRAIINEVGVPIVVQVLVNSPMMVQVRLAKLVARMAEHFPPAQEDLARENVIGPLVTLLSCDLLIDVTKMKFGKQNLPPTGRINKEAEENRLHRPVCGSLHLPNHQSDISFKDCNHLKKMEKEEQNSMLALKLSCAKALWMLAKGNILNSIRISETKGLLCLAKLVETEDGELQSNCLMVIMEITTAAETNTDLRKTTFKTNSPTAKAIVNQLLRLIKDSDQPMLKSAALRAIGSLARTFPAWETRVIDPIVKQLSHWNQEVTVEAVIALEKFACPQNFLCTEHSRTIIEFRGLQSVMRLLRVNQRTKLHGLILMCYLAMHAGRSEDMKRWGVLNAFEGVDQSFILSHPELKNLLPKAKDQLNAFHLSHSVTHYCHL